MFTHQILKNDQTAFNQENADYNKINSFFNYFNWLNTLKNLNTEVAAILFHEALLEALTAFVPLKTIIIRKISFPDLTKKKKNLRSY